MESRALRRYPEWRIQQKQFFARTLGAWFALIGLRLVAGSAASGRPTGFTAEVWAPATCVGAIREERQE